MTRQNPWLSYRLAETPLSEWLVLLGTVAAVLLIAALVRRFLRARLRYAAETETELDDLLADLVGRTRLWLLFFLVTYGAVRHVDLPEDVETLLRKAAIVAAVFQVGYWGNGLVEFWIARYRRKRFETDPGAVTTIAAFGFIGKIAIWLVLILVGLENVLETFDLTPLIASLGVGGIAVALATQKILGDLFASLSIVVDKPFVLGDFITVGTDAGTVEKIGLKTTRVRALSGEQLIFSNSDLLASRVRNLKRMTERRVVFTFGVTYATTREQLERIPPLVKLIVESIPDTRFDRAHFRSFGDSALLFEAVFWMLVPEYNAFMDAQQRVNLELISRLEELGVQFAFPTQTVHIESLPPDARSGAEPSAR